MRGKSNITEERNIATMSLCRKTGDEMRGKPNIPEERNIITHIPNFSCLHQALNESSSIDVEMRNAQVIYLGLFQIQRDSLIIESEGHHQEMSDLPSAMPNSYICPQFKATSQTRLLTERSDALSAKSPNNVRDIDGNCLFTIMPNSVTLRNRRILIDKHKNIGDTIGQFHSKRVSNKSYFVGTIHEASRFKLSLKKTSHVSSFQADIIFGGELIGKVSGDWENMIYIIVINDIIVASISPKGDNNRYYTVVEQGNDVAFIVLIVLALDQIFLKPSISSSV